MPQLHSTSHTIRMYARGDSSLRKQTFAAVALLTLVVAGGCGKEPLAADEFANVTNGHDPRYSAGSTSVPALSGTLGVVDSTGEGKQITLGAFTTETAVRITVTGIVVAAPTSLGVQQGSNASRSYDAAGLPVYDGCAGNVSVNSAGASGTCQSVFCDRFAQDSVKSEWTRLAYMDGTVTAQRATGINHPFGVCQEPNNCCTYSGQQSIVVKPVEGTWQIRPERDVLASGTRRRDSSIPG